VNLFHQLRQLHQYCQSQLHQFHLAHQFDQLHLVNLFDQLHQFDQFLLAHQFDQLHLVNLFDQLHLVHQFDQLHLLLLCCQILSHPPVQLSDLRLSMMNRSRHKDLRR
jgi:hypothetical protein